MCDHETIHAFEDADYWGSDALNQNWDHAVCLSCGIVGSTCDYCDSFWPVKVSPPESFSRYERNGVERCSMCLRCVRCCKNIGRELPLTTLDVHEAVLRFIRTTRHHYERDAKGESKYPMNEMDAHRYSVEERVVACVSAEDGARCLIADAHQSGGGRRGDLLEWRPRGAERYDENNRKLKPRAPSGLYVDFDHHRGSIDPLTLARAIRDLPRRTYVCLGCGGEFTSALAECPFWHHQEATMVKHGFDHDGYRASPYAGRIGGRLLIVSGEITTPEPTHEPVAVPVYAERPAVVSVVKNDRARWV